MTFMKSERAEQHLWGIIHAESSTETVWPWEGGVFAQKKFDHKKVRSLISLKGYIYRCFVLGSCTCHLKFSQISVLEVANS